MAKSTGAFDPSQPLRNHRHEAFVQALLKNMSQTAAYIAAGYSERSAQNNASSLMGNQGITQRLAYLRDQLLDDEIMSAKEVLVELSRLGRGDAGEREKLGALNSLGKYHQLFVERVDHTTKGEALEPVRIYLPDNGRDDSLED